MSRRVVDLDGVAQSLRLALPPATEYAQQQRAIAARLKIRLVGPATIERNPSPEVVSILTGLGFSWFISRRVIPLSVDDGGLTVGFSNPLDLETRRLLQLELSRKVELVLIDELLVLETLRDWENGLGNHFDRLAEVIPGTAVEFLAEHSIDQDPDNVDAPPIVRLSNKIVVDALNSSASDIHLEPGTSELVLRFRIDGVMNEIMRIPSRLSRHLVSRFKVMAGLDIAEKRKPQDGRFRATVRGEVLDLRVSSIPTACGEKIVIRLLVSDKQGQTLEELGLDLHTSAQLARAMDRRGRMILVTGPTGSGKTTTLYTLLKMKRDGRSNITTVEDPVEYRIDGINQIQVKPSAGLTFATSLRSILRQDPDIIMIGEIRDSETAQIAVKAALTGHLVLSSLHTNDVFGTIERLLDLGVDRASLASSLGMIVAQRLIRRPCQECMEWVTAPLGPSQPEDLHAQASEQGCHHCRGSGYQGRTGIFSVLEVTKALEFELRKGGNVAEMERLASADGFRTLYQSGLEAVRRGDSTLDELVPFALEEALKGSHIGAVSSTTKLESDVARVPRPDSSPASEHVLIIDDDEDIRSVLSIMLEDELYEVTEAANGHEGLKAALARPPSIVLCDLMMPRMNGREFLKRLKAKAATKDIPVIILTANAEEESELDLLDLGADDYVFRGTSRQVLLSRIRRVLARCGSV